MIAKKKLRMDLKSYCVHGQSLTCVWLCDLMDYGNIPARILDRVAISSSCVDLSNRGVETAFPVAPALAGGFFSTEQPCKSTLLEQSTLTTTTTKSCKFSFLLQESPWKLPGCHGYCRLLRIQDFSSSQYASFHWQLSSFGLMAILPSVMANF